MTKYNEIPAITSALCSCSVRSKHLNNVRECRMNKWFNSFQESLLNDETEQAKSLFLSKREEFPLLIKGWQANRSYNNLSGDSPATAVTPPIGMTLVPIHTPKRRRDNIKQSFFLFSWGNNAVERARQGSKQIKSESIYHTATQIMGEKWLTNLLRNCTSAIESKMLLGIFKFCIVRHLVCHQWFPKCIACYLFMASCAKKKIWLWKIENI